MQKFIFRKNRCIRCGKAPIGTWHRDEKYGFMFQLECPGCGSWCWTWCRVRRQRDWTKARTAQKWNRVNVPESKWCFTNSGRVVRKRPVRAENDD